MLLHRGHGSTLSGFFGVLSCDGHVVVVSLWCPFLKDFRMEVSLSVEGVLGFSRLHDDDVGDFVSSRVWCEASTSSCVEVSSFLDGF